ncbi:hypothetical protein ACU686_07655 [Yinghuangia aomiensis]
MAPRCRPRRATTRRAVADRHWDGWRLLRRLRLTAPHGRPGAGPPAHRQGDLRRSRIPSPAAAPASSRAAPRRAGAGWRPRLADGLEGPSTATTSRKTACANLLARRGDDVDLAHRDLTTATRDVLRNQDDVPSALVGDLPPGQAQSRPASGLGRPPHFDPLSDPSGIGNPGRWPAFTDDVPGLIARTP